ncbi:MAG: DUF6152 family protein [Gammaproteobacteria bacterium]|nr:DUF6152 family protein [Gammaproteobacteria bacterium]MDH3508909.1 DUF6152 family protein [Gammaproteobacteria bacterium]
MNRKLKIAAVASFVAVALGYTLAFAHHGGSMYNRERELILEDAVVVRFMFVNPHARLLFSWEDGEGTVAEWEGELSGSNELVRSRISADLVEAGDRITVKGFPHDSIPRNLRLSSIVLPDGREVPLP